MSGTLIGGLTRRAMMIVAAAAVAWPALAQSTAPEIVLAAPRELVPGATDAYYISSIAYVWEPLIKGGEDGEPAPQLATAWRASEDFKEWTFDLRRGVRFHDGTPFDADALIVNIERYRKVSPKASPFYTLNVQSTMPGLRAVEKLDTHVVRLNFEQPQPMLPYALAGFGSPIYSPRNFDAQGDFSGFPQGTGPFKLAEHVPDQSFLLVRNDDYYGDKARVERVRVRSIPSPDTRLSALKAGEIMGVMDLGAIPPEQAVELARDPRFALSSTKSTITHYMHPNGKKGVFQDVRMREALSLAVDRHAIVEGLYRAIPKPTASFLNDVSPFHKAVPIRHDAARAAALAREVLGGRRERIRLIVPTFAVDRYPYKAQAELIQALLRPLGLDAEIRILDGAAFRAAQLAGEYELAISTQGLPNADPYTLFVNYLSSKGSTNIAYGLGYANPRVDELIARAGQAGDMRERRRLYDEIQDIASRDLPTIPLFNDASLIAYNKRVTGYQALVYGTTLPELRWAN